MWSLSRHFYEMLLYTSEMCVQAMSSYCTHDPYAYA